MTPRSWYRTIIVVLGLQLVGHIFVGNLFDLGMSGLFAIPLLLFSVACIAAVSDATDDEGRQRRFTQWLRWYPASMPSDPRFVYQEQQVYESMKGTAIYGAICFSAACAASVIAMVASKEAYVLLACIGGVTLFVIDQKYGHGPRR